MASVTVTIPNTDWNTSALSVRWNPPNIGRIPLGSSLSVDGSTDLYLRFVRLGRFDGQVEIQLSDASGSFVLGPEFSDAMEAAGTITLVNSAGGSVTITGISDSSEPYTWTPGNAADVATFTVALAALTDQSLTVTFNDNTVPTMKYDGVAISAWKYNGVAISAAKYNGVTLQ